MMQSLGEYSKKGNNYSVRTLRLKRTFVAFVVTVMAVLLPGISAPVFANEPPPAPVGGSGPSVTQSLAAGTGTTRESSPNSCATVAPAGTVFTSVDAWQACVNAVRHAPTFEAESAIKYAFSKLGTPYSQDSVLRTGAYFDCSSFVGRAFSAVPAPVKRWNGVTADFFGQFSWTGAYVPISYFAGGYRYGYEGTNLTRVGSYSELKPGDIIVQFSSNATDPGNSAGNAGHAQIYIGDDKVIQAGGGHSLVNVDDHMNYVGQEWYFRYNTLSTPKTGLQPAMFAGETQKVSVGTPNATVYGNLTTTDVLGAGFATAYPCSETRPWSSNANFVPGRNRGTFVITHSDANGDVCVFTSQRTNIVWDQIFVSPTVPSHTPVRIVDTRTVDGGGTLSAGEVRKIRTGKPSTVVAGTVTAVLPGGSGYLTLYPCDVPKPVVSNLNFVAGDIVANTAVVKTDRYGDFCVYTPNPVDVIWDQTVETSAIPAQTLKRVFDSRSNLPAGTKKIVAGSVTVLSHTGVGSGTLYGNVTVTEPESYGWAVVYPCGTVRPLASTLNFVAGQTVANFVATNTGTGDVCIYTTATTHILWDETSTTTNQRVGVPSRLLDTRNI